MAVVALLRDASPAPGPLAAVLAVNVRVQAGDDAVTVLETQQRGQRNFAVIFSIFDEDTSWQFSVAGVGAYIKCPVYWM